MSTTPFDELRKGMSPGAQARARSLADKMLEEMPLHELRLARQKTQTQLARVLDVQQAAVSRIERRADMYISTLRSYIEAMGGRLEIVATFPDGAVRLTKLGESPAAGEDAKPSKVS